MNTYGLSWKMETIICQLYESLILFGLIFILIKKNRLDKRKHFFSEIILITILQVENLPECDIEECQSPLLGTGLLLASQKAA